MATRRLLWHAWIVTASLALLFAGCGGDDGGGGSGDPDTGGSTEDATGDVGAEDADAAGETDGAGEACPGGCDDGLACTDDACVDGSCAHTTQAGWCAVADGCFSDKELHPTDPCLVCDVSVSGDLWSPVPDGIKCNDGDACSQDDACKLGVCTGSAKLCDDGNVCTDDSCEAGAGACVNTPNGGPCDDGDPCTVGDTCNGKGCDAGGPLCADGDACTVDACDAGACSAEALGCDDGNPCTLDGCDPGAGCTHDATDGASCEAGDLCFVGDVCDGDTCVEGDSPIMCVADDNPCTFDTCVPAAGCVHQMTEDPCDDGIACTVNDTCNATVCIGTKTESCPLCTPALSPTAQKATTLTLGEGGQPGAGLDVDLDPTTCAPAGDCEAGIDNAMGVLASLLNPALVSGVETGATVTIAELVSPKFDGTPFTLNILSGLPDKAADPLCDILTTTCPYVVLAESYGADCAPTLSTSTATLTGNTLVAGGPDEVFVLDLPISSSGPVKLFIVGGRIEAAVTFAEGTQDILTINGVVAGAIPKTSLLDTVSQVDPEYFAPLAMEDVLNLIDTLVVEDIDLDEDGTPDAASVGIRIQTIPATLTGVQ
jgi:hypothetical protein